MRSQHFQCLVFQCSVIVAGLVAGPVLYAESPTKPDMSIELLKGNVLVRGEVSDDQERDYLLLSIDEYDKLGRADGVIDSLWLFTMREGSVRHLDSHMVDTKITITDGRSIAVGPIGSDLPSLELKPLDQRRAGGWRLFAGSGEAIGYIDGLVRYTEGFEHGLDRLTELEEVRVPWDIGPLFDPAAEAGKNFKALTPCENGEPDEEVCSANCSFGSCRSECNPPTSCPCCNCAMDTFPVCACVSCP